MADITPWQAGKPLGAGSGAMLETADWLVRALRTFKVQQPRANRLERARALVQQAHDRVVHIGPDAPDLAGRVADAQRTLTEFYIIVRALANRPAAFTPRVREKLERMLGGADSEAADTSTRHRDTQFELYVFGLFLMGGAAIRIAEPDLRFQYGPDEVGIAVKRLSSPKQLVKRVMAAAAQIERGIGAGFIAVNLDRFVAGIGGPSDEEDIAARGRRYNESLAPLHALMPRFAERPRILGIMNFGHAYHWDFSKEPPRYAAASFRQMLLFSESEDEVELARLFFDGLSARIGNALASL